MRREAELQLNPFPRRRLRLHRRCFGIEATARGKDVNAPRRLSL